MTDAVQAAERDLELARLSARYDELNDAMHADPNDEQRAEFASVKATMVALRQAAREEREAQVPEEGMARPTAVEADTEVS